VRKLYWLYLGILLGGLFAGIARADTFQLTDGRSLTGELLPASANPDGVQIRLGEGKYERVPWTNFSQADLRKFAQNNKMAGYAESFIEISPEERIKKTEVDIKPAPQLARPPQHSLLGAMLSSGIGLVLLLALYAANIFAASEVALYRQQPRALVCGLAAVPLLGVASPILFLCLPPRQKSEEAEDEPVLQPQRAPMELPVTPQVAPPLPPTRPRPASSTVRMPTAASSPAAPIVPAPVPDARQSTTSLPTAQIFQRGAFMFNRRFFETKFSSFFGVARREADKDMVLVIKSLRGEFVADRISRISANDMHIQVSKGDASEEVLLPFTEIKEIQLKHRDA
jgi:hypothetical protein